jgi:hypothetical protein
MERRVAWGVCQEKTGRVKPVERRVAPRPGPSLRDHFDVELRQRESLPCVNRCNASKTTHPFLLIRYVIYLSFRKSVL